MSSKNEPTLTVKSEAEFKELKEALDMLPSGTFEDVAHVRKTILGGIQFTLRKKYAKNIEYFLPKNTKQIEPLEKEIRIFAGNYLFIIERSKDHDPDITFTFLNEEI